ncbi:MAG: GNAT family N-acetyltransferase [Cyanophyceae cyanobacterium]
MVILKTNRLLLRLFREEDFEEYAALFSQPEVVQYLGNGAPLSRVVAWQSLASQLGHWQLRGYGMWAVEERDSQAFVGRIGFFDAEGWPGFELGWVLKPAYWGRGYATEGAKIALNYAFDYLDQKRVLSLIHPDNIRSIRVAERLGAKPAGETETFGKRVLVYAIERRE